MSEERMAFRAEVTRLLDIVVHSMYSEKQVFLRELISNASDACDKLRYEALVQPELTGDDTDFRITISVDPKARTLTVADNGIGMSRDELIENLGTIARSGTAEFLSRLDAAKKGDLAQIGQFGVGFYAAFMVAQMVEVVSRRAGATETWCWRSDGKGEFEVEADDKPARGTAVTLYLKQGEDEFLSEETLSSIVKRYSDHIALPIHIGNAGTPANRASALWMRSKSEVTEDQYKEFYHHVAHGFEDPALTIHWRAEGVLDYTSLLFVPGMKPLDLFDPRRRHGVKLYVKRVFITDEAEGLVPPYLRFMRGVVDSEDLSLNVSREMLQHDPMLAKMRQGLVRRVLGDLVKLSEDASAYAKVWGNFGAVLKEGLYEDIEHRPQLLKLLRARSTHGGDALVTLDAYIGRMKPEQKAIYYMIGDDHTALDRSPHLEGFKARGIEVLLLTDPVDDFWPASVGAYNEMPFVSATRTGAEIDAIPLTEAQGQTDKPKDEPPPSGLEALIEAMKATLGTNVKDVRASPRLTESPVCLAADETDIDMHLERFLKQHNQLRARALRILEINPRHPLIRLMAERATGGAKAEVEDMSWLLLDQARLLDGDSIADPSGFSRRLSALLLKALDTSAA